MMNATERQTLIDAMRNEKINAESASRILAKIPMKILENENVTERAMMHARDELDRIESNTKSHRWAHEVRR
jgi:hypothetical protein